VLKDNRAIPLIVPVESDAIADAAKEIGERALAVFEPLSSEVLASSSTRSKAHRAAA
jgi:hypothetical protein